MNILFFIAMAFLVLSIFTYTKPGAKDTKELHELIKANQSLRKQAKNKKPSKLIRLFTKTDEMMQATGQGAIYKIIFRCICSTSAGIFIALFLDNLFLVPILGVIGFLIPLFIARVYYLNYQQLILEELEPTLSAITTSYERNNNILQAFDENLPYIEKPIKSVFEGFVYRVKHVDPNIETAIDEMKQKIKHSVFIEWCDALKHCVNNHTLKYTLQPIVSKVTEIKVISGEMKNTLYSCLRTYYTMLSLTIALIIIALWLFPSLLQLQFPDLIKHIVVGIDVAVMAFATYKVYLETKSIKTDI